MFCLINNKQVPRQMNVLNIYSFNPDSPFWLHVENFPFSATVWVFWPFCGQMRSSSLSTVTPPSSSSSFSLVPVSLLSQSFFFFSVGGLLQISCSDTQQKSHPFILYSKRVWRQSFSEANLCSQIKIMCHVLSFTCYFRVWMLISTKMLILRLGVTAKIRIWMKILEKILI